MRLSCRARMSRLEVDGSATLDESDVKGKARITVDSARNCVENIRGRTLRFPRTSAGKGCAPSPRSGGTSECPLFRIGGSGRSAFGRTRTGPGCSTTIPSWRPSDVDAGAGPATTGVAELAVTALLVEDLWAVDAIVVDHVTTAATEVLLTDKPCVFTCRRKRRRHGRALLARAATVDATPDGLATRRRMLRERTFRRSRPVTVRSSPRMAHISTTAHRRAARDIGSAISSRGMGARFRRVRRDDALPRSRIAGRRAVL